MYICICKATTDTQIEKAINEGACTRRDLYQSCPGVGSVCGKCRNNLQQLLDENCHNNLIMQAA